jgi:hypothetical protein
MAAPPAALRSVLPVAVQAVINTAAPATAIKGLNII